MCNPVLIATGVSASMQMGRTFIENQQSNMLAEAEGKAAAAAANIDYRQLMDQMQETNDAATQEKLQRQLQTARERSRIMVAQGEAGVVGKSSLRNLSNAFMQGSYDTSVIEANRSSKIRQSIAGMESVHATAKGRINRAKSMVVNPWLGALTMGMAGTQGAADGYSLAKTAGWGKSSKVTKRG